MKSSDDRKPGGGGLLLGGAAVLMVACCALVPLLVAGGVISAIGAFVCNPWVIGAGVVVVAFAVLAGLLRRRGHDGPDCCPPTPRIRSDQGTDTNEDQSDDLRPNLP